MPPVVVHPMKDRTMSERSTSELRPAPQTVQCVATFRSPVQAARRLETA